MANVLIEEGTMRDIAIDIRLREGSDQLIIPADMSGKIRGIGQMWNGYVDGSVQELTIYDDLQDIRPYAFYGCDKLESIVIPPEVRQIGDHAFEGCTSLAYVRFAGVPEKISDTAFSGCPALTRIDVPWPEAPWTNEDGYVEQTVEGAPWGAENASIKYDAWCAKILYVYCVPNEEDETKVNIRIVGKTNPPDGGYDDIAGCGILWKLNGKREDIDFNMPEEEPRNAHMSNVKTLNGHYEFGHHLNGLRPGSTVVMKCFNAAKRSDGGYDITFSPVMVVDDTTDTRDPSMRSMPDSSVAHMMDDGMETIPETAIDIEEAEGSGVEPASMPAERSEGDGDDIIDGRADGHSLRCDQGHCGTAYSDLQDNG